MNKINDNIYDGILPSESSDVYGWNSHWPIFEELIEKINPEVIIEVGTWLGASALNMCKTIKKLNLKTKIYCVDTWMGAEEFWTGAAHTSERNLKLKNGYPQVYFDFLSNVVKHEAQDIIIPVPNTSFIGSKILKYMQIKADLIYIDGSHVYEDVKSDIINYMDILKPNGVMFGDDYLVGEDVAKAVHEVLEDKIQLVHPNFWMYQKQ
jgi:hypothetical protein